MSETTLVAIRTDTNERVTIGDLPLDDVRALSDSHLLRCPNCGVALTLKAGPLRIHHFAHANLSECAAADHEPESDSHRQGKLRLYRHFRQSAVAASMEQHLPATDQRADVYIEMPGALRYALEFQQANNSVERWTERHRLYQRIGVNDIWFLGQVRYEERQGEPLHAISAYDPLPVPRQEFEAASGTFHARELERAITAADPTLYYLDPESGTLTILLVRHAQANTIRAYRYRVALESCELRDGGLWTPLDPLLVDYRRYLTERGR